MSHEHYDEVVYPSRAVAATDPHVMSTVAHLFGLEAADPDDCDVLDIGCGDGGNLISMASAYPGIRAVGFDPASVAIGRGQETVERLGLTNVALHHEESEVDLDASADYVFAHGVLSWVNPEIREAVIASSARAARPGALVNFSYRAMPYPYYDLPAREAAQYAIRQATERAAALGEELTWQEELEIAKQRVGWIAELTQTEPHRSAMATKRAAWDTLPDWRVWHDDLSDDLHPLRAEDVAAQAAAHGLTYVGELLPHNIWQLHIASSEVKDQIRERGGPSAIEQRQVVDDLIGGGFHSSLFVKGDAAPYLDPAARGRTLYVRQFAHGKPGGAADAQREHAGIARVVGSYHPDYVLSTEIAAELGEDQATIDAELLRLHALALVQVTTSEPNFAAAPGRFPKATAAVIDDILQGHPLLTTRFHEAMAVDLSARRALYLLCDGTRDVNAIRRDLPAKAEETGLLANLKGIREHAAEVLEEAGMCGLLEVPEG